MYHPILTSLSVKQIKGATTACTGFYNNTRESIAYNLKFHSKHELSPLRQGGDNNEYQCPFPSLAVIIRSTLM
mgnify:CR=1 FL=1